MGLGVGPGKACLEPRQLGQREVALVQASLEKPMMHWEGVAILSPVGEMLTACLHSIRELVFLTDN